MLVASSNGSTVDTFASNDEFQAPFSKIKLQRSLSNAIK